MSILDYIYGRIRRGIITFVNIVTLANWELPYEDHMNDTTTAVKQTYRVGTNNQLGDGDQMKLFTSKLTPIFCTTDTYVVFNNVNNVPHYLRANTWYNFKINIYAIHYYYVSDAGTIYAHFGGVKPQEAGRPE